MSNHRMAMTQTQLTRLPSPAPRDTRLDVLRAVALLTIFINHVPGNAYESLTSRNFGLSDAAEAFALISGVAVAFAYSGKFGPGQRLATFIRLWRRAATLYVAHIMATLFSIAIFAAGAIWFARPDLLDKINLGPVFEETPEALVGIATLGHQLGYNNILTMYAGVMLMVPLFLWIGQHSLRAMVGASAMVWLLSGTFAIAPPHYPNGGFWFLNPLSWQFLFVIGMAGVMHVRRGGTIPVHPGLQLAAVGWLVASYIWIKVPLWGTFEGLPLPYLVGEYNKTFLTLPRLLHVLALAYVFIAFPVFSRITRLSHDNPLAVLGRHGLPVFVAGTVLSMVAQVAGHIVETPFLIDTIVLSIGIALQFALAYYLEWESNVLKSARPKAVEAKPEPMPMSKSPAPVPVKIEK